MIPATKAKVVERMLGVRKDRRIAYPIMAPIGSASPDENEKIKARFRLPLAKNIGKVIALNIW